MEYFFIAAVALIVSGLTLFSGFGLGTLLMPAMAIYFPIEIAITATAVVHLTNNIFKVALFGKHRQNRILLKFGLPAMALAFVGAWILTQLSGLEPLYSYSWLGKEMTVEAVKLVVSVLILGFAMLDLLPRFRDLKFASKYLPLGGAISGLMGGISGHQGALRSAFLANAGLTKEQFIGTGVTIACLVDVARLVIYSSHTAGMKIENIPLIVTGCIAAFLGAFIGKRLVEKVTMEQIQKLVAVMLIILSIGLGSGVI